MCAVRHDARAGISASRSNSSCSPWPNPHPTIVTGARLLRTFGFEKCRSNAVKDVILRTQQFIDAEALHDRVEHVESRREYVLAPRHHPRTGESSLRCLASQRVAPESDRRAGQHTMVHGVT